MTVLASKFRSIRTLIDRNRERNLPKKVGFPFVVVEPTQDPNTDVAIKMQADLTKTILTSNRQFNIIGDLEVINRMSTLSQTANDRVSDFGNQQEGKYRV